MPNAAEVASDLRAWGLSLGVLAVALAGLFFGIGQLPEPWPRVAAALLCTPLVLMVGLMAVGSSMGAPLGLAAWGERQLLALTAWFCPDSGAFLFRWAEASPSLDRARERLRMAAARGSAPALREVGRDYLEGAFGLEARDAALPWLRRAAGLGDAESSYWLGEALRWKQAAGGHSREALDGYQRAARAGFRPAAAWLAQAYAAGDGVPADPAQAEAWAAQAAALPGAEVPAPGLLQRIVDRPSLLAEIESDLDEAAGQVGDLLWPQRWFRRVTWTLVGLVLLLTALVILATPLLLRLCILLGFWLLAASLLLRFHGLAPQRVSRSTRRLEARAGAGDAAACCELGLCYERGHHDLPKDLGAAREWYRRAADKGHPEALLRLADLLSWGVGGPRDVPGARRLLERAAALGLPEAWARLGRLEPGLSGTPAAADEGGRDGAP